MAKSPPPESNAVAVTILAVVARIPRGRVTTYGAVAQRAGHPQRARLVGRVLSKLPVGSRVPWHRVVAAGGRIAFPDGSSSRERQIARLRREGVMVANGRASLREYGWSSPGDSVDRWLWRVGDDVDGD